MKTETISKKLMTALVIFAVISVLGVFSVAGGIPVSHAGTNCFISQTTAIIEVRAINSAGNPESRDIVNLIWSPCGIATYGITNANGETAFIVPTSYLNLQNHQWYGNSFAINVLFQSGDMLGTSTNNLSANKTIVLTVTDTGPCCGTGGGGSTTTAVGTGTGGGTTSRIVSTTTTVTLPK